MPAAIVPPARLFIYVQGAQFLAAVSEELVQRQGAVSNFILKYQYEEKDFQANGFYGRIPLPRYAADGLTFLNFNCTLINAFIGINTPGTSGTTEVDIQWAAPGSSTWTSIFSTTPKFLSTAATDARVDVVGTNPPTTGVTAPVFDAAQVLRTAGDALRFNILQAMAGDPVTVFATLIFQPADP